MKPSLKSARTTNRSFTPRIFQMEDRLTPATFFVDPTFAGKSGSQTFNAGQANQATVTIGVDGFANLTDAFTAAKAAAGLDTVQLSNGIIPVENFVGANTPVTLLFGADNPINLVGSGVANTTIRPTNKTPVIQNAVLQADGAGAQLNISNLSFDGLAPNLRVGRAVIYSNGATGTVNNTSFSNIAFDKGGIALSAITGAKMDVTNSTISNYNTVGVSYQDSTGKVQNNTITGPGNTDHQTYGIQVFDKSTVVISGNTISGNTTVATDNQGNKVESANIFISTTSNTQPNVQVFGNQLNNASNGVLTDSTAVSGVNGSTVNIGPNNFSGISNFILVQDTSTAGPVQITGKLFSGDASKTIGPNATAQTFVQAPVPVVAFDTMEAYYAANPTLRNTDPGIRTFAVGSGSGSTRVQLIGSDGTKLASLTPFDAGSTAGARVALGDVDGDGRPDTIVGAGTGSRVQVISGADNTTIIGDFSAFEAGFTGGVFVVASDITGDGKAEVFVTADNGGGSRVRVFDGNTIKAGATPTTVADFLGLADTGGAADTTFRGGTRAGLGDVNGDGTADLIISAGFTGGPRITVWDGKAVAAAAGATPANPIANFFAFEDTLRNGAFVSAGDINGDGRDDLIFGGGPGGGPRVRVADAAKVISAGNFGSLDSSLDFTIANFFAGSADLRGGIRVLGRDLDGDGVADIVTGSGDATTSEVRIYSGTAIQTSPGEPALLRSINPFNATLANGVFVG